MQHFPETSQPSEQPLPQNNERPRWRVAVDISIATVGSLLGALSLYLLAHPEDLKQVIEDTEHIPLSVGALIETTRSIGIDDELVMIALMGLATAGTGVSVIRLIRDWRRRSG